MTNCTDGHEWHFLFGPAGTTIYCSRLGCDKSLTTQQAETMLNKHAALKRENNGLRNLFIDLLAAQGLVTAKREVEIPEELSATLDIGLPLAHRIVDALLTGEDDET